MGDLGAKATFDQGKWSNVQNWGHSPGLAWLVDMGGLRVGEHKKQG